MCIAEYNVCVCAHKYLALHVYIWHVSFLSYMKLV